jgi:hypothetical protein
VPGYVFEWDRLQICTLALSSGEEYCLHAWDLPNDKASDRSGIIDPKLTWEDETIQFDVWLRDFIFSGADGESPPVQPLPGEAQPFALPALSLWYRAKGDTRALSTSPVVPHPFRISDRQGPTAVTPLAENGRDYSADETVGVQDGSRVDESLVVTVYPAQEGRSTLRPNRLRIAARGVEPQVRESMEPMQQGVSWVLDPSAWNFGKSNEPSGDAEERGVREAMGEENSKAHTDTSMTGDFSPGR